MKDLTIVCVPRVMESGEAVRWGKSELYTIDILLTRSDADDKVRLLR